MMRGGVAALALALSACGTMPPPEAAQAGEAFDPLAFFAGVTHGEASLDQIFKGTRRVTVDSIGVKRKDGLLLTQRITVDGVPPRTRRWVLRQTAPGRYDGALTDASGPFEMRAIGRAIRIRYPMKNGLKVEQWLVARPDGRALDNRLTVTKWGIRVATLSEEIDKR
jgi:hypothetical protein